MGRLRGFYASMVGKKVVMGVTGLIGVGFVILHSLGNLLVFRGPDAINSYSHFLKSTGELLWGLRIVLIVAVILHVIAAVQLTRQSRAARPIGYAKVEPQAATIASRTMRWGGAFLLVFITFMELVIFLGRRNVDVKATISAFALTLVPIALVYNAAHNYTYLVLQSQALIPLLNDPLARGWHLLPAVAGFCRGLVC